MATQDLQIYYKRWQALNDYITKLSDRYTQQEFPRKNTVLYLLSSLQAFAAGQFQFFYYGFVQGNTKPPAYDQTLKPSQDFPVEDVLAAILDQIGHDLELIQRAADQRIAAADLNSAGDDRIQQTLADADKLAWTAVKPAIDYAVVDEATTVLTYFEKSAEFYRIPYAQVALIAIPYACISTQNHQDYLAIPHEVGHYVYRHSTGPAKTTVVNDLRPIFEQFPQSYQVWINEIFEETFADIYGCLIAGPAMALDMQELSLAESREEFVAGDCKHPNPVLRPYIYCQVLQSPDVRKLTEDDWQPIAKQLSQYWDSKVKERKAGREFFIETSVQNGRSQIIQSEPHNINEAISDIASTKPQSPKPLDEVISATVETIIHRILEYIRVYNPTHPSGNLRGWAGRITPKTKISELFDNYEKNFPNLLADSKLTPPEADPTSLPTSARNSDDPVTKLWREWAKDKIKSAGQPDAKIPQLWLDWVKNKFKDGRPPKGPIDSGEVKNPDKMTDGTWGAILFADGWATTLGPGDAGHPFV